MTVVSISADGKKKVVETISPTSILAAGHIPITVTFNDLNDVEYIIQFNFKTDPTTYAVPHDAKIEGNVAGVSVYVGAGTTLSGEVIAQGW